jgi:hypothetical protein
MSAEELDQFEERARALLEEGVTRIDARIRSRLNQARHAALAELEHAQRAPWWRAYGLAPAAGVAAAVLVAFVLWGSRPGQMNAPAENGSSAVEDLDLVADGDTFDLLQQADGGSGFYEWAAAQADGQEATS